MQQIEPTQAVSFNDRLYPVSEFPDEIQQTISLMDDWRQADVEATSQLQMIRTALQSIQQTLTTQIQTWEAEQSTSDETSQEQETTVGQAA